MIIAKCVGLEWVWKFINMKPTLDLLSANLGYIFKNPQLLTAAVSHRSYHGPNNERLEFLGDSILSFIITNALYHNYPQAAEGELSRIRSTLVREETLASLALQFNLGNFLRLGAGEKRSGGAKRASILADAMEAIIGAIYLDAGIVVCEQRVLEWYAEQLKNPQQLSSETKDPKSSLQEYLQSQHFSLPVYTILKIEGAQHQQIFYIECAVPEIAYKTQGTGNNRRRAEQEAALKMLEYLKIARAITNEES